MAVGRGPGEPESGLWPPWSVCDGATLPLGLHWLCPGSVALG